MKNQTNALSFEAAADLGLVKLLITDASGQYIPQEFCADFVVREASLDGDVETCLAGPDQEDYWEAWENILQNGTIDGGKIGVWTLMQDGDLWAIKEGTEIDWEV